MFKNVIFIIVTVLFLSNCSLFHVHKIDIEQGNIITPEMTSKLQIGMTENQVRAIMGNTVLVNIFSPSRVDYVYTFQKGGGTIYERRITCIFLNGRLWMIDKN